VRDAREDAHWEAEWRKEQASWTPKQRESADAHWKLLGEWGDARESAGLSRYEWDECSIVDEIEQAAGNAWQRQ